MLLRESGLHDGTPLDLTSVHGESLKGCGVAHAELLVAFAEAGATASAGLAGLRQRISSLLGADALIDAAATVAIFCAVVKIADATGIPLEPYKEDASAELRENLDLDRFAAGRQQ